MALDCLDNVVSAIDNDNLKPSNLHGQLELDDKMKILKFLSGIKSEEEYLAVVEAEAKTKDLKPKEKP